MPLQAYLHSLMLLFCFCFLVLLFFCSFQFIQTDEAYSLADRGGDAFSDEAVRTLLTEAENNRTDFFCCLAGYKKPMEKLMQADPGLPRRFSKQIHLDDYTAQEIALIAKKVAETRFDLRVPPELVGPDGIGQLAEWIECRHGHEIHQHNGGLAVNLTEKAFINLSSRVVTENITDGNDNLLCASDYGIEYEEDHDDHNNCDKNPNLVGSGTFKHSKRPKGWKPKPKAVQYTLYSILTECHDLHASFNVLDNMKLFKRAKVTDDLLGDLTEEGLQHEIGILSYGDRLRIMKVLRRHGLCEQQSKVTNDGRNESKQYQTQQQTRKRPPWN